MQTHRVDWRCISSGGWCWALPHGGRSAGGWRGGLEPAHSDQELLPSSKDLVNIEMFLTAKEVEESLERRETATCLAWCHDNKSRLRKMKVHRLPGWGGVGRGRGRATRLAASTPSPGGSQ